MIHGTITFANVTVYTIYLISFESVSLHFMILLNKNNSFQYEPIYIF